MSKKHTSKSPKVLKVCQDRNYDCVYLKGKKNHPRTHRNTRSRSQIPATSNSGDHWSYPVIPQTRTGYSRYPVPCVSPIRQRTRSWALLLHQNCLWNPPAKLYWSSGRYTGHPALPTFAGHVRSEWRIPTILQHAHEICPCKSLASNQGF